MLRIAFALLLATAGSAAQCGTYASGPAAETTARQVTDKDTVDEVQAFDVYDEITESIFEGFRLYHPYECRDFYVRKHRGDGKVYVDKLRRCD